MKLAYLSASFIPSPNANSVHVMKMCQGFGRAGYDVTLYAHPGNTGQSSDPYAFYDVQPVFNIHYIKRIGIQALWHFDYARREVRELMRDRPDIIYGRHLYGLAMAARRFPHAAIGYESHMMPPTRVQIAVEKDLFCQPNFHKLVVISDILKQDYKALFPFLRDNQILVAHDGADPQPARPETAPALPGRAGAFKACYAGRLIEGKGAAMLPQIAALCPNMDFHVFGGSKDEIAACRAQTRSDNLYFHDHIPHAELLRFYKLMDVMLAPLQPFMPIRRGRQDIGRWTSPLKIFEYMASAKPIICSNLPVLREVLRDEDNAILCPHDNAHAWKAALERLKAEPDVAARIGQKAQHDFLARYTWQARAKTIADTLTDTLPAG